MTPEEYSAFRRHSLQHGMWFVSARSAAHPNEYLGWTVPPRGHQSSFKIICDGVEIKKSEMPIGPGAAHNFLRCGIEKPEGLVFRFDFTPTKKFPDQHILSIQYDRFQNLQDGLPRYISDIDGAPATPSKNTVRTTHVEDNTVFQHTGQNDAGKLTNILNKFCKPDKSARILDWGCGSARVSYFMSKIFGRDNVFGVDVDPINISWVQKYIDPDRVQRISFDAELPFPDAHFDFIYGISVMTHLGETHQKEWLQEIQRVTKSGGLAALTFHGFPHFFFDVNDSRMLSELIQKGFLDYNRSNDLDDGFSQQDQNYSYRNVFNTIENIYELADSAKMNILAYYPGGMTTQDLVVMTPVGR